MTFGGFFDAVFTVEYGFAEIYQAIAKFYSKIWADFNVNELVSGMWWHLRYVKPMLPFILLIIYAVVAMFGQKMYSVLRFSVFCLTGFIIGVYTLSPLVLEVLPTLPTWVIGLITGIVSGVLSKILHVIMLNAILGYTAYILCYRGMIPLLSYVSEGRWLVGLIAAAGVIVLVVMSGKYVEMIATALLGGYGMACIVRGWYDYTSLPTFVGIEWLGVLVLTLLFATAGFIFQYRSREVYN